MNIFRLVLTASIPLLVGGAALGYQFMHRMEVASARVIRGSVIDAVYASGPVEPMDRVAIKARVSGPIGALPVRVGDRVRKGERVARVTDPALGFDVARGRADLKAARDRYRLAPQVAALSHQAAALQAQLDQARTDLSRNERLNRQGAGTQQDLERARTPVATLEAQIAANRAQQEDVRITLHADARRESAGVAALRAHARDVDVYSPMDGVVLSRHVELGEMVAVQQVIFRVGDVSHLWIESRVDEADIGRVRTEMPAAVRLYAFPGRTFHGKVARILPEADHERKSFEVDIDLAEPVPGLRAGMTAEVNIIIEERGGAILVPADAVRERHVWVAHDGLLQRREVEVGVRDLLRIEVLRGLEEGEQVVLEDEGRLRDGLPVSTR
jgi:HlyD family secretion protein